MSQRLMQTKPKDDENPFRDRYDSSAEPDATPLTKVAPLPVKPEPIPIGPGGLQITNSDQAARFASLIYKSKLLPNSFRTPEQVVIAILRAVELGLPVLQALEGMSIINGRCGLMGDLALALVESKGLLSKKTVAYSGEGDDLTCTITLKRGDRDEQNYSFSVREAKQAGIYERSSTWKSYPKRMTYYRALGFGLRDEFSDVLKGIKTIEELQDYSTNE